MPDIRRFRSAQRYGYKWIIPPGNNGKINDIAHFLQKACNPASQ